MPSSPPPGSPTGKGLPESNLESARQRQAERYQEHLDWKRRFFASRPPPPPRDRLHRLNHHEGRYAGTAVNFAVAQQLIHATPKPPPKPEAAPPLGEEESAPNTTEKTETVHDRWLRQMREERERWNPHMDLKALSDPKRTVVMANLPPLAVEEDLRTFANQFGRVTQCRVIRSSRTGRSRKYGFVEFGLPAEARTAVRCSRTRRLQGRPVSMAMERGRVEEDFLPQRLATAAKRERERDASVPPAKRLQLEATLTNDTSPSDPLKAAEEVDEVALLNALLQADGD